MNVCTLVAFFSATSLGGILLIGGSPEALGLGGSIDEANALLGESAKASQVAATEVASASPEIADTGEVAEAPVDRPYDPSRPSGVYANPAEYVPAGVKIVSRK